MSFIAAAVNSIASGITSYTARRDRVAVRSSPIPTGVKDSPGRSP